MNKHLFPAHMQNLFGHKLIADREVQKIGTGLLITQGTDICHQRIEQFVPRFEERLVGDGDSVENWWDNCTV